MSNRSEVRMPPENASPLCENQAVRRYYRWRRVLVTGADGFLGFNCVRALNRLGANIAILTRSNPSRAALLASDVFCGDLDDRNLIAQAVRNRTIVFDFAGSGGAVGSNGSPGSHQRKEFGAQLNLFECCAEAAALLMFCSTRLVYGRPEYLPVDERHPLSPQSFYAIHKITLEMYLRVLAQERGLRYSILRLSNPYGPFQPLGRLYGVINNFIQTACGGGEIVVYGDGRQQRDYIYVDDVIAAFLLAAMNETCHGQTLNLGGMEPISIASAARLIAELAVSPGVRFVPWPQRELRVETGDYRTDLNELMRRIAMPPQTRLADGFQRSLVHYRGELAKVSSVTTEPIPEQVLSMGQHHG
jgi:UDP-glucose 4-epimerase